MSIKSEALREKFHKQMYLMTARSEFCLQVMDALEEKRLPHDRSFTLQDVFDAVKMDEIVEIMKKTPDPLCKPDSLAPLPTDDVVKQTEMIALLAMGAFTSWGDVILDVNFVFNDENGASHSIGYEDFMSAINDNTIRHPVRGTVVHDAQERTEMLYKLSEPI